MKFKKFLKAIYQRVTADPVEHYLAGSYNLCDFEHRLREIERGTAPFQHQSLYISHRSFL
jgi:hypothetical protein